MLALRFGDIDWTRHRIMLRGETTKSGKGAVPLATARLRAVLEWLRLQQRNGSSGSGPSAGCSSANIAATWRLVVP